MLKIIKNFMKPPYTQEQMLNSVPVGKAIPMMSIPAMIGILMIFLTTLLNTFYVGMLNSSEALIAVGVLYPVTLLSTTIAMILGAGLAASIGRYLGAKKMEEANQMASTLLIICLGIGAVFALVSIMLCDMLFGFLGADKEVLDYARPYFIIALISSLFSIFTQFMNYVASAESNVKLGMIAFITNCLLHVILMPLLMFTFGLGLIGVSLTSLLAQLVSLAIMLRPYLKHKMLISLSVKYFRFKPGMIGQVLKSGVPLGITQFFMVFSIALTNIMGKQYMGELFVAGFGVAVKIIIMLQYMLIAYMIGYQSIAAYTYGAKNRERFWQAFRHARTVMFFADLCAATIFIGLSRPLMMLLTNEPQIIEFGSKLTRSLALGILLAFPLPAIITCYQATGKGGMGALVSSLRQGVFYIPLVIILPRFFSEWGFYLVQPVSDLLSVTVTLVLFTWERKKLMTEFQVTEEKNVVQNAYIL